MIPQALPPVWLCPTCGAGLGDACDQLTANCRIDAEFVIHRLEQAGATLLAMRDRSPYPAPYRCALPDVLREAVLAYGWTEIEHRSALPSSAAISQMDATLVWLQLIPQHRYVLRRIVAARSLVDPMSGRHLVRWRKLGDILGCDYRAVQRWHTQGIDTILGRLGGVLGGFKKGGR